MSNHDDNRVEQAAEHWRGGRPLEAGELLFERLPKEFRPIWASRILKLVVGRSGVRFSPIEDILHIADHPMEWVNAHNAFSTLRTTTLDLESARDRTKEERLFLCLVGLAENAAKVIYNATDPPDPFDADSGWWIAVCLKSFLDLLGEDDFSKTAWLAVCSLEE
jgi:hypothetical protein